MRNQSQTPTASLSYSYSIESYSTSIKDAYAALFSESPEKLAELDWRFARTPAGEAQFAIARQPDRKIVGMIAMTPTLLRGSFGSLAAVQAIDTVVDPLARGKFIFVRLGNLIHNSSAVHAKLVWGFPNAIAARGWFGRLGWTRSGSVPFLIKPLRTGYFLARLWPPLKCLNFPTVIRKPVIDETVVNEIDDRWDQLWNSCVDEFGLAVDRSEHWLRWRLDKPGANYRFAMKVGSEGAEAAVITRIVRKHGASICYIMEALSTPKHHKCLNKLLNNELRRAAQDGADLALAWCPDFARNRSDYARVGFRGFPDRFRPIEIHFGGRWLSSDQDHETGFPGKKWYLSYLDSDTV